MPKFNWFKRGPKPTKQELIREELRKQNEEGLGDTSEYDTVPAVPRAPVPADVGAIGDIDLVKFLRDTIPHKRKKLIAENAKLQSQLDANDAVLRELDALQLAIDEL